MVINDVRCLSEYKRGGDAKNPRPKNRRGAGTFTGVEKYRVQVNRIDITKPEWPGLSCD